MRIRWNAWDFRFGNMLENRRHLLDCVSQVQRMNVSTLQSDIDSMCNYTSKSRKSHQDSYDFVPETYSLFCLQRIFRHLRAKATTEHVLKSQPRPAIVIAILPRHNTKRTASLSKHRLQVSSEQFGFLGREEMPTAVVLRLEDDGSEGPAPRFGKNGKLFRVVRCDLSVSCSFLHSGRISTYQDPA